MADQPDLLTRPDFDKFWCTTPRKVGKGAARAKYKAAIKMVSPEALQAATEAHAAIWNELTGYQGKKGKDKIEALKYCPHPATWLHGERWEDEEIQEYVARPKPEDLPEQIKIYPGTPGGDAWMKYEIEHVNQFAKSHWIAAQFMLRPTAFPPKGDET